MKKSDLWLIGAGPMSIDYAKVLKALAVNFIVIGRGNSSSQKFEDITQISVIKGGLNSFLENKPAAPVQAIVSVGVEALKDVSVALLRYGIKNILVEKPAGLNLEEISDIEKLSKSLAARVWVAYNRRFYTSVQKAREIIDEDGGLTSFNFEFTEWSHKIEKISKAAGVKESWFLANSSHVVDLAFFIGGNPEKISCYTAGGLSWHPSASIFSGAGKTKAGVLFSYQANWNAPGRWSVEFLTRNHRLILRPLELLQIQKKGSIEIEPVNLDDKLDRDFKPGLFKQVEFFINGSHSNLCSIHAQKELVKIYQKMANY
jgi:predicted dehydrogenase